MALKPAFFLHSTGSQEDLHTDPTESEAPLAYTCRQGRQLILLPPHGLVVISMLPSSYVLELGPPAQAHWGRLPRRRQAEGLTCCHITGCTVHHRRAHW